MIDLAQLLSYALALAVATAVPGPAVTALVARTVTVGALSASAMLGGLVLGDFAYLSFAVFGLSALIENSAELLTFLKWLSIVYLLWLALQFWRVKVREQESGLAVSGHSLCRASVSGLALALANPKAMAFYLALMPLVVQLDRITMNAWLFTLVPITILVRLMIGGSFIASAFGVRRQLSSQAAQRALRRAAALIMAGAAGTMAWQQF